MGSALARYLLLVLSRPTPHTMLIGKRGRGRLPLVAAFLRFPRFRLTTRQAHIAAWIRRPSIANFIPGIRMRVVHSHDILHQEQPEMMHRHSLPDIVGSRRLALMNSQQDLILFYWLQIYKRRAKNVLRNGLNGLHAQAIRFVIRWHILVTIAGEAHMVQTVVNVIDDRNFMRLISIILRKQAITYRFQKARFFRRKETQRWDLFDPFAYKVTRGFIPDILLAQRMVARIVARLRHRLDWPPDLRVNGQKARGGLIICARRSLLKGLLSVLDLVLFHSPSLLKKLAIKPRSPEAAKSSGAKTGGP